jgi:hypothetical protein
MSSSLKKWKEQLITKEDPAHFHKILGITCLISFIWRLSQTGDSDMGFQRYPSLTIPTFLLHWSLTLSSFIFHIPARRIKSGDRIWPEYRLHALVFLSRSLLVCCVTYYEQYYQLPPNYDFNFLIVMLTLLLADVSSWSVEHRSGSIRELDTHPAVKFFFSLLQFGATAGCLYGIRRFSIMFYMVFVVQVNPFLMTLRRKNLLSKTVVITLYGIGLAGGIRMAVYEHSVYAPNGFNSYLCIGLIVHLAAVLRLGPRLPLLRHVQDNKYLLWISLGCLLRYIRPWFDTKDPIPTNLLIVCQVARGAMLMLFLWKGFLRDWYNKSSKKVSDTVSPASTNGSAVDTRKKQS